MRAGDEWAWAEFDNRFRARLEEYVRHISTGKFRWEDCITEVIEDTALKFTNASVAIPANLTAYLIRAVRNRIRTAERAASRRLRRHVQASAISEPEAVVWSLCSESAIRSAGIATSDTSDAGTSRSQARRRLVAALMADLTAEEQCIIGWVAEIVPYRQIAAWLGTSYDATSKRIWRLLRQLRHRALVHVSRCNAAERAEVERLFRRVGVIHVPATVPNADGHGGTE